MQRAPADFQIRGKSSASVKNMVFFEQGSATLDSDEKLKVAAFALPAGNMLTLNGYASEEGSAAANAAVTRRVREGGSRITGLWSMNC